MCCIYLKKVANSYNNTYNNPDGTMSGWFNKWYNRIADNFPTFGLSAASRNDVINGDEPTKKRRASFIIAASIILALVLLLILPAAVAGPGLFAAGGIAAIAPMITGGVGLLGAAAYFGIKSYQNAQSLKRNLSLAKKRDKIIEVNKKYSNLDKDGNIDKAKQIEATYFQNTHITEAIFNSILDKAKDKFPDDKKLQKIYIGAKLLKCYTLHKIKTENDANDKRKTKKSETFNIADKFNEVFALNKNDVTIQDKNDALLACVARNHYDKIKVADKKNVIKKQLAIYIQGARDAFYNCAVSDNVVNIALNNAVGSYYQEIDKKNFTRKFYDKKQSDKFGFRENAKGDFQESKEADLFDKEIGIQKASILGEALGSALATLPIMTGLSNAAKSRSMLNRIEEAQDSNNQIQKTNNEIDGIFKSYENYKKIDSDVFRLDSSGDGRVTIDECKAYASSKGIAEQDVYDWMKSYGITPPTSTSSTTVESIVMNKSLGAGFTKYINDNYSGDDKSAIDPKVFDTYNSADTTYDEKTKKLTISFGSPAKTITLDEKEMKRFAAATGISFTAGDKDAFSKAVLAKYKVFATEIKSASIYTDSSGTAHKNPSGWSNYLNGLKKQNGFAADSTKGASATLTTIDIPAEMSKAEWTVYEEFFYNNIPTLCQKLKSNGYLDPQDVKDLVDSLFDSPQLAPFLDKEIYNGMTVGDLKTYLYGAGSGGIDYLENFSKYMYYSVQPNGATDAAKYLKNMNALLDKMCSEEPGKSYTEQFFREVFGYSVGDGTATQEVEKFKQSVSSWTKTCGNGVKIANKLPGYTKVFHGNSHWTLQHSLSGEESKEIKAASTKNSITVNWSKSMSLNMLGNNVAPSDTKVDVNNYVANGVSDMKNAAIVGAIGGLGAGFVGGGIAVVYEREANKKNNQYLSGVEQAKHKRTSSKDDDFDALLKQYDASNNPISTQVTTAKKGAAAFSPKGTNKDNDRVTKKPEHLNKMKSIYNTEDFGRSATSYSSSSKVSQVSKVKSRSIFRKTNLTKKQDNASDNASNLSGGGDFRGGIY